MSAENPAVPLSTLADGDTYDALTGGGSTSSGVKVTRDKTLGLSAIWRGVNLIAGDVGRHAFRVYRYDGAGLVADQRHQAALVMRRPNDMMTPFTFRQTLQAHALLDGNGYAYILRDEAARPIELLPLDPGRTWPVRVGGVLWYVFETQYPVKGRRRTAKGMVKIPASDMLHIKGLGFDGLCGYGVVQILRETIGGAIAARDYGTRYFKHNARPGVVLEVPAGMKETAITNLRESWGKMHEGLDNAYRTAILRDGVKMVPAGAANARDAQLLENREFDSREIANVLGVPPHKLGDPSKTAYNSLESENQGYQEDTLDRWFVSWEQESDSKLLTEEEKANESHCCKFDARPITRVSLQARGEYYSKAIVGGWLCPDEVRGYENLNPIPNKLGETFNRPVNIQPINTPIPTDSQPTSAA